MNAINFIKQHGVEKAREVVEGAPEHWTTYTTGGGLGGGYIRCSGSVGQDEVSISDLKRLVESVGLVKSYGGIINAKHDVKHLDLDWDYDTPRVTRLKQAIADYESIYSNDCEILDYPEDYTSPNCKKFDERVNSND